MTNSVKKGKKGERELCRQLRKQGYGAVRSQQVAGISSIDKTADILTSMQHVRWEVKRTGSDTKLSHASTIEGWVDTARDETPDGQRWVVAWRPDYAHWRFLVDPSLLRATHGSADFCYEIETPFVVIPTIRGVVTSLDPRSDFTVMEPDEWMPDEETQLA